MATKTFEESTAAAHDVLARQYVSAPLSGAQTITGTVKGQARAAENDLAINARSQLIIRVVSNDGATVRGTLLAADTAALANEWVVALTNRFFPRTAGSALTSVAALDGDRIVLEIGTRAHAGPVVEDQYSIRFGDTGATDLAEDETTTADNVPWIELSQTLTFAGAGISAAVPTAVETDTALTLGARLTLAVPTAVETDTALTIVATTAPQNTVAPTISGSPAQGQTLTSTQGTWINGPTSFSYQWQRAPAAGGPWTNIAGATTNSYLLAAADVGQHLRCQVTGSNTAGSATASSNTVGPVTAKPNLAALPPRLTIETEWNLDPTATAGTESWRRITHLLREFQTRYGRAGFLSRMETGRFSGRFDNTDRRFESGYAGTIVNLNVNPSIEVGTIGYAVIAGGLISQSSQVAAAGSKALSVNSGGGGIAGDGFKYDNGGARTAVDPSTLYTVSMWQRTANAQPAGGATFKQRVEEYNAAGALIATTHSADWTKTQNGQEWSRHSLAFTTQPTTATIVVSILATSAYNWYYADAFQIERGVLSDYVDGDSDNGRWEGAAHASRSFRGGPYHPNVRPMRRVRVVAAYGNPVEDSSFETVPGGTTDPAASTTTAWWNSSPAGSGLVTRVTSPTPFNGTYCYKAETTNANSLNIRQAQRYVIPVDPGEQLSVAAYFRKDASASGATECGIGIEWLDSALAQVESIPATFAAPTTEWQRIERASCVAPGGARYARVWISAVNVNAPVGSIVYVDAAQIDFASAATPYVQGQGPRTLFRGFMQRFPQHSPGRRTGEVTIDAIDGMAILAADEYAGSPPSENSNARISRLLDDLAWPATLRKLDAGTATLAAATNLKTPHLTHAHEVAETELGLFYIDGPGYAVLHDKNHRTTDPRSTASQATFGDGGGTELPYLPTILPDQDVQDVVNRVKATSSAATPVEQTASDTTSRNQNWTRTKSYKTLHTTDADALTWAQAVLAKLKDPPLEIERLEIDPARDARLWPVALNLEIGDRITINRRPQGTELKTFQAFIESKDHRFAIHDNRIVWIVGFGLSPA